MAVVLPTLRLWLLLLNVYGTFKSMKPPPQSQRSARNGQGPSARAMQLRKRELKSCLAVWVVWSMFSIVEGPIDRTIGLVTPFYNEFKCIVLLFLLVARSHGAEAVFLHIIHPLLRPYVPAVDDILANLHSVFDLLILLFFLPWEYVLYRWHLWRWGSQTEQVGDGDGASNGYGTGDGGEAPFEIRRQLRPRNEAQQGRLREAEKQAQVVFQDIDDAQGRLRTRTRSQPAAPGARDSGRNQPIRGGRSAERDPDPNAVGLRTRRRVLEYPPAESARAPGSRTTGVHHVYPALPRVPLSQPFPALPHAPTTHPVPLPPQPVLPTAIPTPPSSHHEIWYPPESSFDSRASPNDSARRTPSPIYPPLPSAYPFTPRRSEPLPPPPRIISPSHLVTPTPRRVSTGGASRGTFDAYESMARSSQAGPSRHARSAEPSLPGDNHERTYAETFFGQALEQSIQAADMDMETETLSTRDGSSANEEAMEVDGGEGAAEQGRTTRGVASKTQGGRRTRREPDSEIKRGKRKATEPLRRSTRARRDRSSSVETDEFGFTVRPKSSSLESTTIDSVSSSSYGARGPSKKPLARTKPALKAAQGGEDETESSDEESVKKRRKLGLSIDMVAEELEPGLQDAEEADGHREAEAEAEAEAEESTLRQRSNGVTRGRGKRKAAVGKSGVAQAVSKDKQAVPGPSRATRASTRQPISAREGQPEGVKRGRRR